MNHDHPDGPTLWSPWSVLTEAAGGTEFCFGEATAGSYHDQALFGGWEVALGIGRTPEDACLKGEPSTNVSIFSIWNVTVKTDCHVFSSELNGTFQKSHGRAVPISRRSNWFRHMLYCVLTFEVPGRRLRAA